MTRQSLDPTTSIVDGLDVDKAPVRSLFSNGDDNFLELYNWFGDPDTLPTSLELDHLTIDQDLTVGASLTAGTITGTLLNANTSTTTPKITSPSGVDLLIDSDTKFIKTGTGTAISLRGDNTTGNPVVNWQNTALGTDLKTWEGRVSSSGFLIRAQKDDLTAATTAYNITRGSTYNVAAHLWYTSTTAGTAVQGLTLTSAGLGVGSTTDFGSGTGVISIKSASVVPTTTPTGGGVLYVDAGILKYKGSSGTVTTIAAA